METDTQSPARSDTAASLSPYWYGGKHRTVRLNLAWRLCSRDERTRTAGRRQRNPNGWVERRRSPVSAPPGIVPVWTVPSGPEVAVEAFGGLVERTAVGTGGQVFPAGVRDDEHDVRRVPRAGRLLRDRERGMQ